MGQYIYVIILVNVEGVTTISSTGLTLVDFKLHNFMTY